MTAEIPIAISLQRLVLWAVVTAFFCVWLVTVSVKFIRHRVLRSLVLATAISTAWVLLAGVGLGLYDYELRRANKASKASETENYLLSLAFPWAGFALGLVAAKECFLAFGGSDVFSFVVFWAVLLLIAETVGRHYGNVTNVTSRYRELQLCDCLHAPAPMKAFYFSVGGVFFALDRYLP